MASSECSIDVHVRRTGEVISLTVTPQVTTYGDIIQMICQRIPELDPNQYYIAANYENVMEDSSLFRKEHKNSRFQMIMKTKYLLEFIAEQAIQKQRLEPEIRQILNTSTSNTEMSDDDDDDVPTTPQAEISPSPSTPEERPILVSKVVKSAIEKIPQESIQQYLHQALGKAFDILLLGSPRVGKSTLINAILKKDLAKTSAGRNACTSQITSYEYQEIYTSASAIDTKSVTISTCSIRIWDAPGIEDWSKFDVAKYTQDLIKDKNPICLIYCVSPGSYADLNHVKILINECKKLNVFIALVVTNMYASDEVDDILDIFKTLLAEHSRQTKIAKDVFYYDTIGLCTLVNSVEYETQGVKMKVQGVDELMLGIMNSLTEEKLLQWCFALMDNGPFWIRTQSRIWRTFNFVKRWIGY